MYWVRCATVEAEDSAAAADVAAAEVAAAEEETEAAAALPAAAVAAVAATTADAVAAVESPAGPVSPRSPLSPLLPSWALDEPQIQVVDAVYHADLRVRVLERPAAVHVADLEHGLSVDARRSLRSDNGFTGRSCRPLWTNNGCARKITIFCRKITI